VDVVPDISITGTRVYEPSGRYLMTVVDVSRPNLGGALVAWALRRTVVPVSSEREIDVETERRRGREAFRRSHRLAVELAERELGVDPAGITIAIRDRGITGASAGLVYALAILDLLDPDDRARSRTIAATGELQADGRVGRVGFLRLKAEAARGGGAQMFIVPVSQRTRVDGLLVVGAGTLREAVRALSR
jgi:PDZ domain-containing protein